MKRLSVLLLIAMMSLASFSQEVNVLLKQETRLTARGNDAHPGGGF